MSDAQNSENRNDPSAPPTVVGIGASAGGLSALKAFFRTVPAKSGAAYVVVVHLAPEHESHLADLLQPHSAIPVRQVLESTLIEPDQVYVIPPNANLEAIDTHLRLTKLPGDRRNRAPVDHFFRTLAETHDGHSVGVILTGTGSDGTRGLRVIKERGGVTIVQLPEEAEFDGMPRNAIASGDVDLVLPLTEITQRLAAIVGLQHRAELKADPDELTVLPKVFAQIRARTGHDFSQYKPATIRRRIGRRMQLCQVGSLKEYSERLQSDRDEALRLFEDLLITVTEFFRDDEVFQRLERQVVPDLFDKREPDQPLRVWSVGCSTGEEAYSIAILLLEEAARRDLVPMIQVFASDLHERSVRKAREGVYPDTIAADVSPERLQRYFLKEDGTYRIRKEVRELVVFASHSLLKDPPFSHLDMIVCRNVLIYLQRGVQLDIASLFHYALKPDGVLVLGTAETIEKSDLFSGEDKRNGFYRRRNVPTREPRLPVFPLSTPALTAAESDPPRPERQALSAGGLHAKIVEQYAPPSVLVGRDHHIIHSSATAAQFLQVPAGEPSNNLLRLVREPLRVELGMALHAARESGRNAQSLPVTMTIDGVVKSVVIKVRRVEQPDLQGVHLVIFDEVDSVDAAMGSAGDRTEALSAAESAAEVGMYKQRLQGAIEEFETSQEEMTAANEELQSANEELRSTLEELETSKEELQSMNEELATVNQENRHRVEELSQLTADLNNFLAATQIGTLFLDCELRIVRYTPQIGELFNIRHSDRGRPLSDFTHRLSNEFLYEDARRVLERMSPIEREVLSQDGRWYLTRILPYRTTGERIEGVVITLIDVSTRRQAEEALRASEAKYRALVEGTAMTVWELNPRGEAIGDSPSWRTYTGQSQAQFVGMGWIEAVHPDDREHVRREWAIAVATPRMIDTEFRLGAPDGKWRWTNVRAAPIYDVDGRVSGWIAMNLDITDRKLSELALRETDRRKDEFLAMLAHEIRNPLAPLVTGLEVLRTADDPLAALATIQPIIQRQTEQLTHIVDDLLEVSRITRGKLELKRRLVSVAEALQPAVEASRPAIDKASHAMTVIGTDQDLFMYADPYRVTQILTNLLGNAAKFSPPGGRITLEVRRADEMLVFSVTDAGIGIAPEMQQRVFDIFVQGESIEKDQRGLGIGLTLAKTLVELHGGRISVSSDGPTRGSKFTFTIPALDAKQVGNDTVVDAPALTYERVLRVLIVDDNRAAVQMLAIFLKALRHEVETAYDGLEAVEKVGIFKPDVVLMDLSMPRMDGFEAADRIRREPHGESVTLVALTGWGQEEIRQRTKTAGFDCHLVKPVQPSDLKAFLAELTLKR